MRLLIPAVHYRGRAIVRRIWGWSPIEEAVFLSLKNSSETTESLSKKLGLNKQILLASVTRLMQFGLVEIQLSPIPMLAISSSGKYLLESGRSWPEREVQRDIGFGLVFEKLGQSIFLKRDVEIVWKDTKNSKDIIVELPKDEQIETSFTLEKRILPFLESKLRRGETLRGIEVTSTSFKSVFLNGSSDVLRQGIFPENTSAELKAFISEFNKKNELPHITKTTNNNAKDNYSTKMSFDTSQLILGSNDHLLRFEEIVSRARDNVFILSTFLPKNLNNENGKEQRERIWNALEKACRRGVKCHLFYGDSKNDSNKNASSMLAIKQMLEARSNTQGMVLDHLESVQSHCKFLIADDGEGSYLALIGSCNWLSSPYRAIELSAELHDTKAVGIAIDLLRSLISPISGVQRSSQALHFINRDLEDQLSKNNTNANKSLEKKNAKMTVLWADDHERLLRKAAHDAQERFICCSHRAGVTMVPGVFNPAVIAGGRISDVRVYYSIFNKPIKKTHIEHHRERLKGIVNIQRLIKPTAHSKFLLWDSDDVIISSMNWASQSGTAEDPLDEIGLHINCPGLAKELLRKFEIVIQKSS